MTKPRPARATSAPGLKHLITATSLAATLTGWALLAPREQPAASVAPNAAAPVAPPLVLAPPVMPTLVPLTTAATAAPLAARPAAVEAPPPVATAAPVAPPPLREVSAPAPAPVPVASTRSSN